jgi:hypothetical protein
VGTRVPGVIGATAVPPAAQIELVEPVLIVYPMVAPMSALALQMRPGRGSRR